MLPTHGYAALTANAVLQPFSFERRDVGDHDVLITITHCGICHSDIHQARDEWGISLFPMVPGHEIIGTVAQVGAAVTAFKVGDRAGVGCFVDSCRMCGPCREGLEQYCDGGPLWTYSSQDKAGRITQGGYSTQIVVDESYVLRIPSTLSPAGAAPLLCAGITTYSPLRQWGVGKFHKLAVVGLGGLGHMAVKIARAMGTEVTVLSTSEGKREDAKRLGAANFAVMSDPQNLSKLQGVLPLYSRYCLRSAQLQYLFEPPQNRRHHDPRGRTRKACLSRGILAHYQAAAAGRLSHRRHKRNATDARLLCHA